MTGYHAFANGELLTAQKVNDYLMSQVVVTVPNQTDRDAIADIHDGLIVYREDLDVLQIRSEGAWKTLWQKAAFDPTTGSVTGAQSITNTGTNLAAVASPAALSIPITATRACKARVTLRVLCSTGGDTIGEEIAVILTGATTLNIPSGDRRAATFYGAGAQTVTNVQLVDLNAGVTNFIFAARAVGAGGARNVSDAQMIIEPAN